MIKKLVVILVLVCGLIMISGSAIAGDYRVRDGDLELDAGHSIKIGGVLILSDSGLFYSNIVGGTISGNPQLEGTLDIINGAALNIEAGGQVTGIASIDLGDGTIEIYNTASGDMTVGTAGQIGLKLDEDLFVFHGGAAGEIQGEAAMSLLDHIVWSGDPGNAYDSDTEAFIMTVGDDYPHGMTIVEWKCSCNTASPDAEINADLRYADAWTTLANAADIDEIDTSSGVSSEDTAGNINSGSAVANGKVIYIGFDGDPEGTCTQMVFEMWGYAEED